MRFNAPRGLRPGIPDFVAILAVEAASSAGRAAAWAGLVIVSAVVAGPSVAGEEIRRARMARKNRRDPWERPGQE